jgi:polysaccharide export outer membrane protein
VRLSVAVAIVASAGCALLPPQSFLDPTKVGQFPAKDWKEHGIRRVLTPRDTPPGLANATEPTPEDLLPSYDDYRLGAGDLIAIQIQDFFGQDRPFGAVVEVSPTGEIRLPDVGSIKISGLTEGEIEREITARCREAKVLPDAVVQVFVQQKRTRVFNVIGWVQQPGVYPITDPNMRLLDAIALARDAGAEAKRLYVIRRAEVHYPEPPAPPAQPPAPQKDGLVIPLEPEEEENARPGGFLSMSGRAYVRQESAPATRPGEPTREELESVLAPDQATRPVTQPAERHFEPITFDPHTGRMIEAEPAEKAAEKAAVEPPAKPFDWEELPETEVSQRVIQIELLALKNGDPRLNIVVRDRDTIQIPIDTGVYYMMGEINRPGVYSFGGREITVKQAVATAGNFSPLAWPARCEIIRREPGTDKQITIPVNLDAIFAGLEEDLFLRDDDIINVGSDVLAPFLFVIRNSFRFTYGFGFVYDRNYADKDSYEAKANPYNVNLLRSQTRGLPF